MATSDKLKSESSIPPNLLPVLKRAGVLTESKFEEVRGKVLQGDYPLDSTELARRLVKEKILTEYQARKLLGNKPHTLMVGRYVILDRLGSGSMGRVYKAKHLMMDRTVALKVIAPEIGSNKRVVARFQREIRLVGKLDHPNVVRAFDADKDRGILYIAMEYVPGETLGHRLKTKGIVAPLAMIEYAAQAARGLQHAHDRKIVHRDVKPSNLLVSHENVVKVLDLGLSVLLEADEHSTFATADGIAVGTIDYMAPEQACGQDVDGRSDLFSLGCTMYHMITGRLPYQGSSPIERLGVRINGRPVPITDLRPNLPTGFPEVLDRLLANRPGDRYQTATEAAEALQALLPGTAVPLITSKAKASPERREPSASPPKPAVEYIRIAPAYPWWLSPLAGLAERSPGMAGLIVVVLGLVLFGCGLLAGMVIRF